MSKGFNTKDSRPPPPKYCDALHYPKTSSNPNSYKVTKRSYSFSDTTHGRVCYQHLDKTKDDLYRDHVYQSLPCEPFEIIQQPYYKNVTPETLKVKFRYIYSFKKLENGRPVYVLEAIPETLATSQYHMGVKTYEQVEVIASQDIHKKELAEVNQRKLEAKGTVMCGVGGVQSCEGMSERLGLNGTGAGSTKRTVAETVQSNGKAVIVPINGMILPNPDKDRMVVESLLSEVNTDSFTVNGDLDEHDSFDDLPPPPNDIINFCDTENDQHSYRDFQSFPQALEPQRSLDLDDASLQPINALDETDIDACPINHREGSRGLAGREHVPLLPVPNAQPSSPKLERLELPDANAKRKSDCDRECADSGYSDCNHRLEFKEHVTDYNTDHVTENVIYSEPEYSSSEMSLKYAGESPSLARTGGVCQRTLKRTNNGVDHTVFELSPSDSFYNSADNVRKGGIRPSSVGSSEGICRIGQSSSSLAEGAKARQPLNRDTSVSFKKPLVVGPRGDNSVRTSPSIENPPPEPEVDTEDGQPLVTAHTANNSVSSIPSHLMIEDSRSYYRRKAADRGTLYCVVGGITVVATIVFLLIYFS